MTLRESVTGSGMKAMAAEARNASLTGFGISVKAWPIIAIETEVIIMTALAK